MTALIDNYKAIEPNSFIIPFADIRFIEERRPLSNSTVLDFNATFSLNLRIKLLLNEFYNLKNDWDECGAVAPEKQTIGKAKYMTSLLEKHGQSIYHTAPGPNGEIMLDIRNGYNTRSLEIIFYADRAVSVLFPKDGKPTQHEFDFKNLPNLLQWLNQK